MSKTILILCRNTEQREAKLGSSAVTPGMLIEVSGTNVVTPASPAANQLRVAIEMAQFGKDIDFDYTFAGEATQYAILTKGDIFYGLLKAGSNASAGSFLANDGAGGLVVVSNSSYSLGKAIEAVDNSLGSGYVRIKVQFTGSMPATTGALPVITVDPADDSIASGATATLTVTATGEATLHYQWYNGIAPSTTTPVGTDSNSYTTPALTADKDYWVKVYNSYGSDNSTTAHITVT